jgi:hypothetical protein
VARTRISRSLAASPRASSASACMERHTARYASFDSTQDGLHRVDRGEAYRAAVRHEPPSHRSRPSMRTLQLPCRPRRPEVSVWAVPAEVIALQGCVLTHRPVEDGYIVVGAGHTIKPSSPSTP